MAGVCRRSVARLACLCASCLSMSVFVGAWMCSLRTHFPICVTDLVSTNRRVSFRYKWACVVFSLSSCVNGRCWNQFFPSSSQLMQLNLPPLHIHLWTWLSVLLTTEKSSLFVAPASEVNLRNEPSLVFVFFPLVCICWIIKVNGAFLLLRIMCLYLCAAQTASCESCISAGFMWS